MWATVLFALLAIAIGGWLFTAVRQAHKVRALERSKEEIQVEETLVYDFLHGRGEGLLGTVWATAQPVCLADIRDAPDLASLRETALGTASVMATPLLYGKQNMGVLALGNGPTGTPFSQSDFVVFKSIAEQSAFA